MSTPTGGAIRKLSTQRGYAGGGLLDGLKRVTGIGESPEMAAYRAQAATERAAATPKPTIPTQTTTPTPTVSATQKPTDIFSGTLKRREAEAGLKNGGAIKGPTGAMARMASKPKPMVPPSAPKGSQLMQGDKQAAMTQQELDEYRDGTTGYKAGGAIKKMAQKKSYEGAKLKGPGTPTSDDIPATVVDTGEPIKVATKERIVSEKQGKVLEREAKSQGYKNLDQKFLDKTGTPVGPTIKYSKGGPTKAAANGFDVIQTSGPTIGTGKSGGGGGFAGVNGSGPTIGVGGGGGGSFGGISTSGPTLGAQSNFGGGAIRKLADGGAIGIGQGWKTSAANREYDAKSNMTGFSAGYANGGKMKHCANGMNPLEYAAADLIPGSGITHPGQIAPSSAGMAGGGFGANWQQVPTFKRGGAIGKMAACSDGGTMRPQMRGYADGGEVKKPTLADAVAYGTQFAGGAQPVQATQAAPYTQVTPTSPTDGGVVSAPVRQASPQPVAQAEPRTMSYGEQMSNVGGALKKAGGAVLGAPVEALKYAVSAPGYEGTPLSELPGMAKRAMADLTTPSAPAAQPAARPAAAPAQPYQASKAGYGDARAATSASAPGAIARLSNTDGKDVGYGTTRFDVPGKSPLFTNMTDAAGMASNEKLINRGPVSAENQKALQGLLDRQSIGSMARAQKAQYDAEVAGAKAINNAPPAYDPEAGARRINDLTSATNKMVTNLPVDRTGKLTPESARQRDAIYQQALGGGAPMEIAQMRDRTDQRGQDIQVRGQDLGAANAIANQRLAQQRVGLDVNADKRAQAQSDFQTHSQQRVEKLHTAYENARGKDREAIAEQLRVMTGKDKPDQWKAIALQGSTDAMGNKTEGVVAAVNSGTGEIKKYDQGTGAHKAPPKEGEVIQGHKFKGGNPADQKNWEKI